MNYSKKILLIIVYGIIIYFLSKDKIELDLNNYLNKLYGEEELLKIIKEKGNEKNNSDIKKRNKIEKEIENFYWVIEKIKKIKKTKIKKMKKTTKDDGKLILSCSYALNNGYLYPTLVAMTSLVVNARNNTFYNIYVLVSPDFTEENKNILISVEKNYTNHCKVIIINMGDKFKGVDTNSIIPTSSYYRLDIQNILPNVDRILYMDGDTAVFQDLSELITLDMEDNYILGFLDSFPYSLRKFKIKNAVVLCAGVLLMDLNALRINNISEKYNEFIEKNLGNIYQHDQTIINVVGQGKIGTLPPKYGIWNFRNSKQFKYHNNDQLPWLRYNKKECLISYYYPAILHYVCGKPYLNHDNKFYFNEWWEYAKITGYYDKIYN